MGEDITEESILVRDASLNLSAFRPEMTPQRSTFLKRPLAGIFTAKSFVRLMMACEYRDGLIATLMTGGLEQATPHHAIVMIFAFLQVLSTQLTNTTGTG
jgi:hypothetical protein